MILISKIFCTGFGVGKIPFFPGTLASLSILPIIWVIKNNQSTEFFLIVIAIYLIISYFLHPFLFRLIVKFKTLL